MSKLIYCIIAIFSGAIYFFLVISSPWWLLIGGLLGICYLCFYPLPEKIRSDNTQEQNTPSRQNTPSQQYIASPQPAKK